MEPGFSDFLNCEESSSKYMESEEELETSRAMQREEDPNHLLASNPP
jgi:hypothetical protein